MIVYQKGDILQSNAQVLVNPVNIVGAMGKGLALQFRAKYPEMFIAYKSHCDVGALRMGEMFWYPLPGARYIVCFPTKLHWRNPSQMWDIQHGLIHLHDDLIDRDIESVALPRLGCGLGGLNWGDVKQHIEFEFSDSPILVNVYT